MTRVARDELRDETSRAVREYRGEEQVHMVAHQRPGVDRACGFERALAKQREIGTAVAGAGEAGGAGTGRAAPSEAGCGLLGTGETRHGGLRHDQRRRVRRR